MAENVDDGITVGQAEIGVNPQSEWPILMHILKNFGNEGTIQEVMGLDKEFHQKAPTLDLVQQNELSRSVFLKKWRTLSRAIRAHDVPPTSESFLRQSFVASVSKEFLGKRISSCVVASTLNALVGLGFVLIDMPKVETELLTHLSQLFQKGEITYNNLQMTWASGLRKK